MQILQVGIMFGSAGDRLDQELGWAQLIKQYDVFDHLRTYHDEKPKYNEYNRPEYNFAGLKTTGYMQMKGTQYWSAPWTHHWACLMGYVPANRYIWLKGTHFGVVIGMVKFFLKPVKP